MSRRISQRDLKHDADPYRFGEAMMRCEGYAPECSAEERCAGGGECFAHAPHLVAARMIEKLIPRDGRAGLHLSYLRRCAAALREGRFGPMTQETEDVVARVRNRLIAYEGRGPETEVVVHLRDLQSLSDRIDVLTQALERIREASPGGEVWTIARAALHQEGIGPDVGP